MEILLAVVADYMMVVDISVVAVVNIVDILAVVSRIVTDYSIAGYHYQVDIVVTYKCYPFIAKFNFMHHTTNV